MNRRELLGKIWGANAIDPLIGGGSLGRWVSNSIP